VPDPLALADHHIAEALPRIQRQQDLIEELCAKGCDTRLARDVCTTMTDILRLMYQHRRRLRRRLKIEPLSRL
jgi:hypothetical protein